jgi:hypothetical protein
VQDKPKCERHSGRERDDDADLDTESPAFTVSDAARGTIAGISTRTTPPENLDDPA